MALCSIFYFEALRALASIRKYCFFLCSPGIVVGRTKILDSNTCSYVAVDTAARDGGYYVPQIV